MYILYMYIIQYTVYTFYFFLKNIGLQHVFQCSSEFSSMYCQFWYTFKDIFSGIFLVLVFIMVYKNF